jgi:hypothetical protein
MYFIKRSKNMKCHILEDVHDGKAPCGVRADKLDLIRFWAGRETPQIIADKPTDVPLCRHCEKLETSSGSPI